MYFIPYVISYCYHKLKEGIFHNPAAPSAPNQIMSDEFYDFEFEKDEEYFARKRRRIEAHEARVKEILARQKTERLHVPTLGLFIAKLADREPDLKDMILKLCRLQLAEFDRRSFDSAERAFEELKADTVAFARLARVKMRQLGAGLCTFRNPDQWSGFPKERDVYFDRGTRSVSDLHSQLFNQNGCPARLTCKTWKMVKVKGSDEVCFYSDAYHLEEGNAFILASACSRAGLNIRFFEWDYPGLPFDNGYFPPKTAKVIGWGYDRLYRGKLIGYVVGSSSK